MSFPLIGQCQHWCSQPTGRTDGGDVDTGVLQVELNPAVSEDGAIKSRPTYIPELKLHQPSNFFSDFSLESVCCEGSAQRHCLKLWMEYLQRTDC